MRDARRALRLAQILADASAEAGEEVTPERLPAEAIAEAQDLDMEEIIAAVRAARRQRWRSR